MKYTFDWRKAWTQAKAPVNTKNVGMPLSQWLSSHNTDSDAIADHSFTKAKSDYGGVDIVYSATDLVASNFSCAKLVVKETDSKGNLRDVSPKNPLQKLLNQPNWRQNQKSWLYAVSAFRVLGGDSYSFFNTGIGELDNTKAQPAEIWQFGQDRFELACEGNQFHYQYNPSGTDCFNFNMTRIPIDPIEKTSNVMQWSTFNPSTLRVGQSQLAAASLNTEIYNYGNIWNRMYFKKGCRPSLAVVKERKENEGYMDDTEFSQLKKEIDEVFSGLTNGNGRPLLLDGLKPMELSASPKDADFEKSHDQMQKDIARSLRIPPILLALGSDSTFDNQKEAKLSLWTDTEIPLLEDFVMHLNNNLTPRYGDNLIITIDTSEVQALEPIREKMWKRAEDATFITLNEKREMVGLDPVLGGDVILVPSNNLPLDLISDINSGGIVE